MTGGREGREFDPLVATKLRPPRTPRDLIARPRLLGPPDRQSLLVQNRLVHLEAPVSPVGPNLHGVVGRKAASIEGFRYSANMRQLAEGGLTWDEERLRAYLTNPKTVVPQGSMAYPGLRNEQQLTDLLAYLKQQSPGS